MIISPSMNDMKSLYPQGAVIFREGEAADSMYYIHSGRISITIQARATQFELAQLQEGDYFGEMALFAERPRSATATALTDCELLKITKGSLDFMLSNRNFTMNLLKKMSLRLYHTDEQIEELLFISPETRLLKALGIFWREAGKKDARTGALVVPFNAFLDYCQKTLDMDHMDSKLALKHLRNQELIALKRTRDNESYILFSPKSLKLFDLIFSA